jgi:hypothetical protein
LNLRALRQLRRGDQKSLAWSQAISFIFSRNHWVDAKNLRRFCVGNTSFVLAKVFGSNSRTVVDIPRSD